ncbi:unnamed protein product, partial [marine sediment metagenome]
VLLDAGTPANDLALEYPIRPVEDLALLVKCVVAGTKTADEDYIFITGKDWRGAAQTESIDVSAGDGTYEPAKYWSVITTLDCSDEAAGSGNVWGDGNLTVTQDIWGVIWDYGNGQYKIDSHLDFGNGSTTSYFKSELEMVYFATGTDPIVTASANLRLGEKDNDWGRNGSFWSYGPSGGRTIMNGAGSWSMYASHFHIRTSSNQIYLKYGDVEILNSINSGIEHRAWPIYFNHDLNSIIMKDYFITNIYGLNTM